jgi:hypothetical protein
MLRGETLRDRKAFQLADVEQSNIGLQISRYRERGVTSDDADNAHSLVLPKTQAKRLAEQPHVADDQDARFSRRICRCRNKRALRWETGVQGGIVSEGRKPRHGTTPERYV